MKVFITSFLLFFLFSVAIQAQNTKPITGTVNDDQGVPLPGATVQVVDGNSNTVTDFDGKFSVEAAIGNTIRVSYVSFQTQEFIVGDQNDYTINLIIQSSDLDEVVVVGYGSQKRSDISGSVVSVDSEDITKQPALTPLQSIQGKVAGVNIVASDAPGATPTVLVRGLGTALGGRDPFYVVDGQPIQDIRSINPNNIESIEFLKGASYANIYGIRAANGVILITTKKGKKGKPVFSFDSYYGIRSVLNQVEMANADQYVQYFNEENAPLEGGIMLQPNQPNDTDWYDELLQMGTITSNNFSVSGAGETINYFFSYNFYDEEGILDESNYSRGTLRSNNTFHLFDDNFRIIQSGNIAYTNESPKPFGTFNNAYRQSPLVPVFYDNGRYGQSFVNQDTGIVGFEAADGESVGRLYPHGNPIADLAFADEEINTLTLQGQFALELDLSENLQLTTRFGATQGYTENFIYNPLRLRYLNADPRRTEEEFELQRTDPDGDGVVSTQFANNSYTVRDSDFFRWNIEGFITYSETFDVHSLSATVGLSRENFGGRETISGSAFDVFEERRLRSLDLNTSSLFEKSVNQSVNQSTNLQSYFARFEYDFDKRYFVRGVLRRDGTSDFVTGENFFDNFPAVSVGWTISNESFLEDSNLISNLKLFAGWGEVGNANVPFNVQQVNTNAGSGNTNYVFGPTQDLIFGAAFASPVQPLQWEVTEEIEAGFDYALFNNKLSGTFSYYNRTNTNAIIEVRNILNSPSEGNFLAQAAEVSNVGFEGLINWQHSPNNDFSYNIGLNFSTNKNEVQNVAPGFDGILGGNLNNGRNIKQFREGEPIFAWWLYEVEGVWQTQEEIDNNPTINDAVVPGHLRYKDNNEDGIIDDRDRKYFGTYIPTFNYGIRLGAQYKQVDFSVDGFGVGGNKVYNGLLNARQGGENIPAETFNNRWTGPGSTNSNPGAARDREPSNYYLEDGDYFRINNITLGYTFEDLLPITSARIYVTAQNPFMFTNYSGFTPEINQDGNPRGTTGIELSAYPTTRTFILGANFKL